MESSNSSSSPRYYLRPLGRRKQLRPTTSLPLLRLTPSDRPLFTCQACCSSNVYVPVCPFCSWSSEPTSTAFENGLRLRKRQTISSPQLQPVSPQARPCSPRPRHLGGYSESKITFLHSPTSNSHIPASPRSGWSHRWKPSKRRQGSTTSTQELPPSPLVVPQTPPPLRPRYSANTLRLVPPYLLPPSSPEPESPSSAKESKKSPHRLILTPPSLNTSLPNSNSSSTWSASRSRPSFFSKSSSRTSHDTSRTDYTLHSPTHSHFHSHHMHSSPQSQSPSNHQYTPTHNHTVKYNHTANEKPMPETLQTLFAPIDPLTGSPLCAKYIPSSPPSSSSQLPSPLDGFPPGLLFGSPSPTTQDKGSFFERIRSRGSPKVGSLNMEAGAGEERRLGKGGRVARSVRRLKRMLSFLDEDGVK